MGCDHVVYTTEGVIKCTHCGVQITVPFPVQVDGFCMITTEFVEVHQNCKEQIK